MKRYKYLIFDCDGTLLDSRFCTVSAFEKMVQTIQGRPLTEEEREEVFHRPSTESLLAMGVPVDSYHLDLLNTYYFEETAHIQMFDGLEEVLRCLQKKGIPMGMATNRDEEESLYAMKYHGLSKYLEGFTCRDYVRDPKPSGAMLTYYLEKYHIPKEETLFLGNGTTDHLSAIDAGLDYAYCMWGTTEMLEEEAYTIEDPREIMLYVGEDYDSCE
ncbi:MAG: HAD family hydrolase [Tissierellia bacterium]|nr:HAD family hydrolase [Tissierellia bacterium]